MLQRSIRFGALACLLGLSAAACGSDGGDEGAQPTTVSTAKGAAAAADESDPSTWGVKDKKLVGPAGFTIDLAKCPSKWDDKAGLTDSEIRLGQTLPQSGALAAYGGIGQGMKAIFDHVNATEGGIAGRKINLVQKDDGYEAARGKANVDEMLETGNPFAIASSVGTPIVMATYEKIDESCVPDLFAGSGHPAWGDPVNHPWVISVPALSYSTEALLWGDYILAKYGKGITVAGLVNNNEFGAAYRVAFEKWAKDNGVTFKYELHDPQAASVTNEMTTLAATNADVVVLMTAGNFCTMGIKAVAESSWRPKERLVSNTCNGLTFFKPAGAAAEGWVSVSDRKDVSDPADQKDPKIAEFRDILSKAGLDPNNTTIGGGIGQYGWSMVDLLQRASKLPGGLSRTNAMLAARSVNTVHPYFRDGIKYRMNGNKDAYPIEGAITVRWTIPPGQENGSNVPFGTLKDLDGQTPNCAWDGKTCKDG